jgi:two-component system, chemotaxis family, CheB/CheR fusion protein
MTSDNQSTAPPPDEARDGPGRSLTVVGIGASAGGLQALRDFFEAVSVDGGMAYVVITHLDPDRKSEMAELIQARSTIPVQQATQDLVLEADHGYVIPPNQELRLEGGKLRLTERSERGLHSPVDLFFRTLAEACGSRAVGVLLSGTGRDGTDGLGRIRQAGGITVAQTPEDAEYDGMPRNAIAMGLVDLVLPASKIPSELQRLHRDGFRLGVKSVEGAGTDSPPADTEAEAEPVAKGDGPEDEETLLRQIFARLRSQTGHDFSRYKLTTIRRRIERRASFNALTDLEGYRDLIRRDPGEARALLKDLLISVSGFFRDPKSFEVLRQTVIPKLFEGKTSEDRIRVWVPGCATGEEAYSLAMLLHAHAATLDDAPEIQVFATDIDEEALSAARAAHFPLSIAADIAPELLRSHFRPEADGYRVTGEIRDLVLVAKHDLLRDPPFSGLDLVSCRNVLIYLQPDAQAHALAAFHYALHPGGLLFLGGSESVDAVEGLFTVSDKRHRIFRRMDDGPGPHLPVRRFWMAPLAQEGDASGEGGETKEAAETRGDPPPKISVAADLHLRLLEAYAPPSLVVNEAREVVHLSLKAGDYLRVGGGEPSLDVLELTPGDLRDELRTALYQALEKGRPTRRAVRVGMPDHEHWVDLVVRPLRVGEEKDEERGKEGKGQANFALIVFEERPESVVGPEIPAPLPSDEREVHELQEKLERTRAEMKELVEERQDTIEELQTAIEELQSINEEQKATGEELETSREELQSTNEELTTVNQEYRIVIAELNEVNADLRNLINATEIGTVFLDRELRVRRFTPAITSLINLVPQDRGRPMADLSHRLRTASLFDDAAKVLSTLETITKEVESEDGDWYTLRLIPYRSLDDRIDGVVLTLFDITTQKRVEAELREALRLLEVERTRLSGLVEHLPAATLVVDADSGKVLSTNMRFRELLQHDRRSADSPDADALFALARHSDGTALSRDEWPLTRSVRGGEVVQDLETDFELSGGETVTLLVSSAPLLDPDGRVTAAVMTLTDISRRLEMEEELRRTRDLAESADHAKSAFMATVSHELRTPLNAIVGYADVLSVTGSIGEGERKHLERIQVAGSHLSTLLEEILQFSRLEEGQVTVTVTKFDAREIAREAGDMVKLSATGKGLDFQMDLPDERVPMESDPHKVRQILVSLLGNAVKFTETGEVRLGLHIEAGRAVFEVTDTGVGIAPDHLDLIFERFWRVGGSNAQPGAAGTGIGLAVARQLASMLEGELEVASEVGRGSTFTLRLPLPEGTDG